MAAFEAINILIAGDAELRASLMEQFAQAPAIAVGEAATPQQALLRLQTDPCDVLLVADNLPSPGAEALLASARGAGFAGAAILLASENDAPTREFDAALPLPLRFGRLLALVREMFRAPAAPVSRITLGEHIFCEATQTLSGPDGERALTEKETAILARLARAQGDVVSRHVLLREIWGYNPSVTTHTLETHVHRLRRKIEATAAQPKLLLTAQGGYRLISEGDLTPSTQDAI
jgi:DNA-binding response OmpR family regulator